MPHALKTGGEDSTAHFAAALLSDATTSTQDEDIKAILFNDPTSYPDAMTQPDAEGWKIAMREEWQALLENDSFQEVTGTGNSALLGQADIQPIDSKWVCL
jgi:hypothetical protein